MLSTSALIDLSSSLWVIMQLTELFLRRIQWGRRGILRGSHDGKMGSPPPN